MQVLWNGKSRKNRQKDKEVIYGKGFFEGVGCQKQQGIIGPAN
jgi:hypothetical protein